MSFFLIGESGLFIGGSTEDNHVALWGLFSRFKSHTSGRGQHIAVAIGATEAGIEEYHGVACVKVAEFTIQFLEGITCVSGHAVAVNRQQESIFCRLVGNAVTGVIENHLDVSGKSRGNLLDVAHGAEHCAVGRVLVDSDIVLGQSEGGFAIFAKYLAVVSRHRHRSDHAVVLVSDNHSESLVPDAFRNRKILIHIGYRNANIDGVRRLTHALVA